MRDKGWAKRILSGDRAAGERLVTQAYPRIYRMLRNLSGHSEIAEDLTQQTFARAWQSLPGYRGEASLMTWLHSIAYHEFTHWLRARRDLQPLEDAAEIPAPAVAEQGLITVMLRRALMQLSEEHRETFVLFYIQDLSVQEVAHILGVPVGTVKSRLSAARGRLRGMLKEDIDPVGSRERLERNYLEEVAQDAIPISQNATR